MSNQLKIGDQMPYFSCKNENNQIITNEDVVGVPLILYFYPKDNTPGCTNQACSFRDLLAELPDIDKNILGVSADSPESHRQFIANYQLNFSLLSDEQLAMCKAFHVIKEDKIERTTFVIDPDGTISWIEQPVQLAGHANRVLNALNACA